MKRYAILMHGLGRTRLSMSYMASKLEKSGYTPVNVGYPSLRRDLEFHVDMLYQRVIKIADEDFELNFVTHSLGSIILRRFAIEHHTEFPLARAVMLGPPNRGSSLARKLSRFPMVSAFMGPGFRRVKDLDLLPATDKLDVGVIAGGALNGKGYSPLLDGDDDGIVSVAETHLDGARDHIVVRGIHTTLMFSGEVIKETLNFLENGQFSAEAHRFVGRGVLEPGETENAGKPEEPEA